MTDEELVLAATDLLPLYMKEHTGRSGQIEHRAMFDEPTFDRQSPRTP
jgi:hypothetical protein